MDSGIGITKNAFNAPTTGPSTPKKSVSPFQSNATPTISTEAASHATSATTSSLDPVSLLPSKLQATSAAQPGTGRPKNASNAPKTGSSKTESALPYPTNATLSI